MDTHKQMTGAIEHQHRQHRWVVLGATASLLVGSCSIAHEAIDGVRSDVMTVVADI